MGGVVGGGGGGLGGGVSFRKKKEKRGPLYKSPPRISLQKKRMKNLTMNGKKKKVVALRSSHYILT